MRVVSENTDKEIAKNRAEQEVAGLLRDLTANLLRITRGAGKPHEVGRQAYALVKAYQDHWDAAGHWPDPCAVSDALSLDDEYGDDLTAGQRRAVRGALQIAASELLDQRTQQAAGESELFAGVNAIEAAREKWRREWEASRPRRTSAAPLPTRTRSKRTK